MDFDPVPAVGMDAAPLALVVELVRSGRAVTRPELVQASGLSRKVVTQRAERAMELNLLIEGDLAPSRGGRHARTIRFNAAAGYVFAAMLGASEVSAALLDLNGTILDSVHRDWPIDAGPDSTMNEISALFTALRRRTGAGRPWGIGIGLPGPVDFAAGRLVSPPIMPGWDGFSARSWLRERFDAPVWVDNDVNLMAMGEWRLGSQSDHRDMLYLKVGTGIGAGLITRGRLMRGIAGAAGDIGHTHVTDDPDRVCRCGRTGCLEAVAGGWSILAQATERIAESTILTSVVAAGSELTLLDLGRAYVEGDVLARELIESSAHEIAAVAANIVNFCNPGSVVLGGGVLRTGDYFLRDLADTIEKRCTDLVTRNLSIRNASMDFTEGLAGAGFLALDQLLNPNVLTAWIEDGTPLGHATTLQRLSADAG